MSSSPAGGKPEEDVTAVLTGDVFRRGFPCAPELLRGVFTKQPNLQLTLGSLVRVGKNIDIRPTTLQENLRANLFPDKIESVVFSFKAKLLDITLEQVSTLEDAHRGRARVPPGADTSIIVGVARADPSESLVPWGTLHKWREDATLVGAETWTVARAPPPPLSSPLTFHSGTTAVKYGQPIPAQPAAGEPGATAGSVTLSDGTVLPISGPGVNVPAYSTQKYRVHYYSAMGGDFFYTDVLPETGAGAGVGIGAWFDWAKVRGGAAVKGWWSAVMGAESAAQANTLQLPQPPSRNPDRNGGPENGSK